MKFETTTKLILTKEENNFLSMLYNGLDEAVCESFDCEACPFNKVNGVPSGCILPSFFDGLNQVSEIEKN